ATKAALAEPRLRGREVPRNAVVGGRDFTGYHPPLSYWLGAAILRPLAAAGTDLPARVAALRLMSVALGTLAVAAAYAFAAPALPGRPGAALGVAALGGFQPALSLAPAPVQA